jgi:hypothetical protein
MTKKRGPGPLGGTIDEIKAGTFLDNARVRSSRRKSQWNLLLPAVILPFAPIALALLMLGAWLLK